MPPHATLPGLRQQVQVSADGFHAVQYTLTASWVEHSWVPVVAYGGPVVLYQ